MKELPKRIEDCFASDGDKFVFWLKNGIIQFEKIGIVAQHFIDWNTMPLVNDDLCKDLKKLPYLNYWGHYGGVDK
jgi:hypothetical protein